MKSLLIKNGNVIDAKNNIDEVLDILVVDGKITSIDKNIKGLDDSTVVIDASEMWVVAGLIDLHVHLREPGYTHKETIESGSLSAMRGGVTTICAMPNTNPVIDEPYLVEYIKLKAEKEAKVNVLPIGAITKGQNGKELTDFEEMKNKGICAVSEDGKSVLDASVMNEALIKAKKYDIPMFSHCEDTALKGDGQINEGKTSEKLGVKGITNEVEDSITARDIVLADKKQSRLHICHVSTKGAVDLIEFGKKTNKNLTCEVAPHHFTLTDEDIKTLDGNYKMAPPLRNAEDKQRILDGLKNDIIDVIATDHAPHAEHEKNGDFNKIANGIVGLETLVPLTITELVHTGIITKKQFVEKTSFNPAKILGIDKGYLSVGAVADITIINANEKYVINKNEFLSKSKNTPFDGREVRGKVKYTIVNGEVVYQD